MIQGENLDVEAARELGLINEILPDGDFRASVRAYATRFVPPHKAAKAVGHIKRAVCSGLEMPFTEGLALERELQQGLFTSNDAQEGIAAYVEKRKPAFSGN
jgi:enoyl-CoA hydratase/carnithine racemase